MYFSGHPFAKKNILNNFSCRFYVPVSLDFPLITSCPLYRLGGDVISAVSAYSEIPSSIRVVEDGYGDARLSWFFSVPPDSFVTTSSAVLDLCLCIQRSRLRSSAWKTVMVTQHCRGFYQCLRTALLRRHQLSSICVCVIRDPVFDSRRGRRLW